MTLLCSVHNWVVSFASLTLVLLCNQKSSPLAHLVTMESRDDVITRREYEAYYTEKFKKRLLHRLHMTEPPRVNTSFNARQVWSSIPHYVKKMIERENQRELHPDLDEDVREVFIIAKPTLRCSFNFAAGCFILDVLDDISRHHLLKVTLNAESQIQWIQGKTLSLWEAFHTDSGALTLVGTSPIHEIVIPSDNSTLIPIEFDLTVRFSHWLRVRSQSFIHRKVARTVVIRCNDCDITDESPVNVNKVILAIHYRSPTRNRRSIQNRCSGLKFRCCTEKLLINLSHLGWERWILSPQIFEVNYCRGQCVATNYGNTHAELLGIVAKLPLNQTRLSAKQKRQIIPCCSARIFGTQSIIFLDQSGKTGSKSFPDFNVINCGCM